MKKLKFYFMALALLICSGAKAEVIQNYVCDFETTINTSDHSFKVAPGWGHIVDVYSYTSWGYEYSSYADYTYKSDGGVDNSHCLTVGSQSLVGSGLNDLLVTPMVSGKITLDVKGISASYMKIKFYNVTREAGKLIKGVEISATPSAALNNEGYVTYTIEGLDNQLVGIWGNSVRMDNFTATSAEIVLEKKLSLASVKYVTSTTPDCDAEGNYTITAEVQVKNNGEAPLTKYTVSIYNNTIESKRILGSVTVEEELAVGAEKTVAITGTANINEDKTDETTACQWYATEDVTGTTKYIGKISPIAYAPILIVNNSAGNKLTSGYALAFGYINANKTADFSVQNGGAASMTVTSVTCPAGFSVDLTALVTLAAHESKPFTVTANADVIGSFSGDLVITAGDQTFTLSLSSTVLDPNKYFEGFEGSSLPAGYLDEKGDWIVNSTYGIYQSNTAASRLITPKLHVESESDVLTFNTAALKDDSSLSIYIASNRNGAWEEKMYLEGKEELGTKNEMQIVSLTGIPAGDYYIAFEGSFVYIDNIYGFKRVDVADDVVISSTSIPAEATDNNPFHTSVTVKNINDKASVVKAELYIDGKEIAASSKENIESLASTTISFENNIHGAGIHNVNIVIKAGDLIVTSESKAVSVKEETIDADIAVGTQTKYDYKNAPVNCYDKNSEGEVIYTADQLNLNNGDKISKITFRGCNASKDLPVNLSVYMENTSDATVSVSAVHNVTEMTNIFKGDLTCPKIGTSTTVGDALVVTLDEPFVYTGGNIRISIAKASSTYAKIQWEVDGNVSGQAMYRSSDGDVTAASWTACNLPVVHFGLVIEPTVIAGTLTDYSTTAAIADANIEVKNTEKDVIYTGKTDAEGKYSISVIQNSLDYVVSYSKDSYPTSVYAASFAEGSVNQNAVLGEPADYDYTFKAQYGTVILPFDAVLPEGMKAYTCAEAEEDGKLTLVEATTIAAGKPYIVEKTGDNNNFALAGTKTYYITAPSTEGLLTGVFSDYTTVGGEYVLQNNAEGIGFYLVGENAKPKVPANRAYIAAQDDADAPARAYFLGEADDATAINTLSFLTSNEIEAIYTTNGVKVNSLQKGLNIVKYSNGQTTKILVK